MPAFSLITSLHDDLLLPWLDLYERAFPQPERVPVSHLLGLLKRQASEIQMLAALDEEEAFAGLAIYAVPPAAQGRAAFLWYLATLPQLRGQGLGAWMYRGILARLPRTVEALFFDVEIPEQAGSPEAQVFARRRIGFYRRLGARRMTGIYYANQAGPDAPLLQMHLMAHLRSPLAPAAVCDLARSFLPEAIQVIGEPGLE